MRGRGRGHSKDCVVLAFHMSNDLLMGGQREWIICSAPLCVGGARERQDEEDVGKGEGMSLWDTWLMPLFVQFLWGFWGAFNWVIFGIYLLICLFSSKCLNWLMDRSTVWENMNQMGQCSNRERVQCTLPLSLACLGRRGMKGRCIAFLYAWYTRVSFLVWFLIIHT